MKKIPLSAIAFLLLTIAALLLQCSKNIAGAGSETTNGITGSILNRDGSAAAHALVKLFPATYNPTNNLDTSRILVAGTNGAGTYHFSNITTGVYTLVARDTATKTVAQITNVTINTNDTSADLPPERLLKPGLITARFSAAQQHTGEYIFLPGTDLFAPVDSTGSAVLDGVPPRTHTTLLHVQSDNVTRNILRDSIAVGEQDTASINNPAWRFTRNVVLNTSPTGADIATTLHHFPVLLRLSSDNFTFGDANASGDDLIFTKADNSSLPFEIEYWDSAAQRADIWISIDTLYGNSTTQVISMYWGNAAPVQRSTEITVFDTASGFEGVWHLSELSGSTAADATQNGYSGTASGMDDASITEGMIGKCRVFNGTESYITMPNTAASSINFPQNGTFSISAWVYTAVTDEHSHVVVSKGNTQYFLWYTPIHLNATLWEFANYRDQSGWDLSTQPVTSGEWVLLTGVRDGTTQHLYVNDVSVDSLIDYPFTGARDESFDLMIGRFAQVMASPNNDEGYSYFNGSIDEVRISSKAYSADWVRLCYRNQRSSKQLITLQYK